MNKGIIAFLGFACGTAAGFMAARKLMDQHYRQQADEEIESVKRAFRKRLRAERPEKETGSARRSVDKKTASSEGAVRNSGAPKVDYTAYYSARKKSGETREDVMKKPYVIPPDQFDTLPDYETISLKLFSDGVVADDDDRAMSEADVERTITRANLRRIGEYEPDSVFVRNEGLRVDYEVLTDERSYKELLVEKPYLNDD